MAIVWAEGFDDGNMRGIGVGNVGATVSTAQVRTGTRALRLFQQSGFGYTSGYQVSVNNLSTLIVNVAWYSPFTLTSTDNWIQLRDAGTSHVELRMRTDNRFEVSRYGVVLGVGSYVYTPTTWVHLALKVTISDSVGAVELRINGSTTPDILLTNVDTKNTSNAYVNEVVLLTGGLTNTTNIPFYLDDLVIQDTTGAAPENSWLGDVECAYLFPNAAGDASGWNIGGTVPAATRHESLDDVPSDDATTTVDSATPGDTLLMQFQDLPVTEGTVFAVIPLVRALKSSAGSREIRALAKLGGTTQAGTTTPLSTSWQTYQMDIWHRDPTNSVWTTANVNLAQFGLEVVT